MTPLLETVPVVVSAPYTLSQLATELQVRLVDAPWAIEMPEFDLFEVHLNGGVKTIKAKNKPPGAPAGVPLKTQDVIAALWSLASAHGPGVTLPDVEGIWFAPTGNAQGLQHFYLKSTDDTVPAVT